MKGDSFFDRLMWWMLIGLAAEAIAALVGSS